MRTPRYQLPTIQKDACDRRKAARPNRVAGFSACWACTVTRTNAKLDPDETSTLLNQCPDVAREWLAQSNGCPASQVSAQSNQLAQFACGDCGHRFKTKVSARTKPNGQGCPICYARQRGRQTVDLNHFPQARSLFESSSRNGGFNLSALPVDYKVYFRCAKGRHSAYLSFLEFRAQGYLCSACHGRRALVADVQTAFTKTSFFQSLDLNVDSSLPHPGPSDPCAQYGACSSNFKPNTNKSIPESSETRMSNALQQARLSDDTLTRDLNGAI